MDLTWGPGAGWKWLWYRLGLVRERHFVIKHSILCSISHSGSPKCKLGYVVGELGHSRSSKVKVPFGVLNFSKYFVFFLPTFCLILEKGLVEKYKPEIN